MAGPSRTTDPPRWRLLRLAALLAWMAGLADWLALKPARVAARTRARVRPGQLG